MYFVNMSSYDTENEQNTKCNIETEKIYTHIRYTVCSLYITSSCNQEQNMKPQTHTQHQVQFNS